MLKYVQGHICICICTYVYVHVYMYRYTKQTRGFRGGIRDGQPRPMQHCQYSEWTSWPSPEHAFSASLVRVFEFRAPRVQGSRV